MRISDWSSDVCSSDLWDAYGEGPPDAQGRIYRAGANDDALGVAGLFEIARLFKAAPPPDRTIAFAFWTAEERGLLRSEEHTSELQSLMRISYAVFCLTKQTGHKTENQ